MTTIGYLAHDLSDPAIARRARMLAAGGATVRLAGLQRGPGAPGPGAAVRGPSGGPATAGTPPGPGAGMPPGAGEAAPLVLGQSADARLVQRAATVGRIALLGVDRIARHFGTPDVILARNLEMLAIGARVSRAIERHHGYRPRLVYECLDIHRLLTHPGPPGIALRALEARLGRAVDLVLTSSPAFVGNHLGRGPFGDRILLVENKVLDLPADMAADIPADGPAEVRGGGPADIPADGPAPGPDDRTGATGSAAAAAPPTPAGPPWRIGWFGALRCARSFEILAETARRAEGRIEVVIRGRPSPAVFPDLPARVAAAPHVRFEGPYDNPADLARIYGEVQFAWCIDFYEEGGNSAWLLPNRLYESAFHNTLPIALAEVETGRFLQRQGFGLALDAATPEALAARLSALDAGGYAGMTARLSALPRSLWSATPDECRALVAAVAGRPPARPGAGLDRLSRAG